MNANTTYSPPIAPIEDLGDGTFYYNFNIIHSETTDDEGNEFDNYDYNQVRCKYPIEVERIQQAVDNEGYEHTVEL